MADPRALQFDHVNGDGNRRQRGGENSHRIVKAILDGSTEFQLLCANCNWIKKFEKGEVVGGRVYERIQAERRAGVGRGRAPGQQDAMHAWWATATEEEKAERIAKSAAGRKGRPNPKALLRAAARSSSTVTGSGRLEATHHPREGR